MMRVKILRESVEMAGCYYVTPVIYDERRVCLRARQAGRKAAGTNWAQPPGPRSERDQRPAGRLYILWLNPEGGSDDSIATSTRRRIMNGRSNLGGGVVIVITTTPNPVKFDLKRPIFALARCLELFGCAIFTSVSENLNARQKDFACAVALKFRNSKFSRRRPQNLDETTTKPPPTI